MNTELPKTRKEAKLASAPFYFTNKPCRKGHISQRYTSNGGCQACSETYYDDNRELLMIKRDIYVMKNYKKVRASQLEYYRNNIKKVREDKREEEPQT